MPRAKGQGNVTDDAILAALPGTATEVGQRVGLSTSAAAWRLRNLNLNGWDVGRGNRTVGQAPVWERRRNDRVPVSQARPGRVNPGRGGLLCLCGVPTSEHPYAEVVRGCPRVEIRNAVAGGA